MKKNIFAIAAAAILAIGMTACEPETIVPGENNAPQTSNTRVKSTADLIGTNWTYTMDEFVFTDEMGDTLTIPSIGDLFYLNFDADYAHFTFSDMVEAWGMSADGMSMEQISGVDYEYSYDGATHTGNLIGTYEEEDGTETTSHLVFTYNDATDEITFVLPMAYEGDTTIVDVPVVFHRAI